MVNTVLVLVINLLLLTLAAPFYSNELQMQKWQSKGNDWSLIYIYIFILKNKINIILFPYWFIPEPYWFILQLWLNWSIIGNLNKSFYPRWALWESHAIQIAHTILSIMQLPKKEQTAEGWKQRWKIITENKPGPEVSLLWTCLPFPDLSISSYLSVYSIHCYVRYMKTNIKASTLILHRNFFTPSGNGTNVLYM